MRKVMNIVFTLLGIYAAILVFFYFSQTSMLFFPQPLGNQTTYKDADEVYIETPNGNRLHGWLCKGNADKGSEGNLIIYFGGNAEEVSHLIPMATTKLRGWDLLLINYPGYGLSEGKPSEKSFFDAAQAIYDYAISQLDVKPENIVLLGRSIGTGCAVYLAGKRDVSGVILVSPFESIRAVAQSKLPFLPVSLLLKHKFESKRYAQEIDVPLLAFFGTADDIIPPKHSKRLAEDWKGSTRLIQLDGYDHNNIFGSGKLWNEVVEFLSDF